MTVAEVPCVKLPLEAEINRRSFDSSEWNVPELPSAQELLMVLGRFTSVPPLIVPRPRSRLGPESQEVPTVAHLGALRVGSNVAVCGPPPPDAFTVKAMVALWLSAPEVPLMVTVVEPVVAVPDAVNVSVEVALPFAGGVTGLVEKAAVTPLGNPEALRVTAELKLFRLVIVIVLVPLPPCVMVSEEGDAPIVKSGVGAPPQPGNLKLAMRVFQLKLPVAFMYSVVNQKVQSSTGSTVRAL